MNILLVDDEPGSRISVAKFLRELGHDVVECGDGEEAANVYKQGYFPMVLSDIRMPDMSGLELLKAIKSLPSGDETDVILFTGYGDMDSAISALRAGAYDYMLKPVNAEEIAFVVQRVTEHQSLRRENERLTTKFDSELEAATRETKQELSLLRKIVGETVGLSNIGIFSPQMENIVELAKKYHSDRSLPVLIQGETGTGKEIIARIIHYGDPNKVDKSLPFIDVNCATFTANLFESELFGYEPGSFTGGLARGQKGKLDAAMGGTLFLDEVAEISLELQGKLLRVIQEKEFYRVGGVKKVKTDVRIVCASNVALAKKVEEARFRQDLYYRLKVGQITIPPLRTRQEEIVPLALLFLREFAQNKRKHFSRISTPAANILKQYNWPGNVRELRNVIEWATFMYDDVELKSQHLGAIRDDSEPVVVDRSDIDPKHILIELTSSGVSLEEVKNKLARHVLELHHGNKSAAARYLGVSRRALCTYLEEKFEKNT